MADQRVTETDKTLPSDAYSKTLRALQGHPGGVEKTSVDGHDTVFLQRVNAEGGDRWVLPPDVTAAIARQRDGIETVNRKRGARQATATRKARAK